MTGFYYCTLRVLFDQKETDLKKSCRWYKIIVEWYLWMWLLRCRNAKAEEERAVHCWNPPSTAFPTAGTSAMMTFLEVKNLFQKKWFLEFWEEQR